MTRNRIAQVNLTVVAVFALLAGGCGGGKKAPTLSITTTALPGGEIGVLYNQTLTFTGGKPPVTWSVTAGALPAGLNLSSNGAITGTPTTVETANFTVQATDSGKQAQTVTRALSIAVTNPLRITTTSLPSGTVGAPYNQTIGATGGVPPYTWGLAAGNFPPGVNLTTTDGTFSGTPTSSGTFNFSIQVTDSDNPVQSVSRAYTVQIASAGGLAITTNALPPTSVANGSQVGGYGFFLEAQGGTGNLTWSLAAGSNPLPSGLSLDATGLISGQAAGPAGTSSFTARVDDQGAQSDQRLLSITVNASLGRNDTIANATPVSNGVIQATLSPMDDPIRGTGPFPDVDVYQVTVTPGNVVSFEIFAKRLVPFSPADSVMEIVNVSGTRLTTCRNQGLTDGVTGAADPTPTAFDDACLNDDISLGVIQDSMLELEVPTGTTTVYVRILDWAGWSRPEVRYQLVVTGAD